MYQHTYQSDAEELKQLFESVSLKESLNRQGVIWHWQFIPKHAPWYDGFWERLIGLTKAALKKVLGWAFISLATLQTMVVEMEAHLNNWPLTYISLRLMMLAHLLQHIFSMEDALLCYQWTKMNWELKSKPCSYRTSGLIGSVITWQPFVNVTEPLVITPKQARWVTLYKYIRKISECIGD